jgi:glucose-6-phosphate isomerase
MLEDPLLFDYSNMLAESIGHEHGILPEEIDSLKKKTSGIIKKISSTRAKGELPFLELPYQDIRDIISLSEEINDSFDDLVVLGIGGSALGAIALLNALTHPYRNLLTKGMRRRPRVFVYDNVDPDQFKGLLDLLDITRTAFNIVTKSGSTAETMASFMVVRERLTKVVGPGWQSHIIATTDPKKGDLRKMASEEGYRTLDIPSGVGGRFSVFTPAGLFPAAVAGIDIEGILKGAESMDKRCSQNDIEENPAAIGAILYYIANTIKGKYISVMMPYSYALEKVADWFCQLWAESLGKKLDLDGKVVNTGQTPVKALGATDQHSQLQLYMEGPNDKTITFLRVERFIEEIEIPKILEDLEGISYLGGHSLSELLNAEQKATEMALTNTKRPNMRITLPDLNPHTVGQLLYLLQVETAIAGGLYNINPYDQPGVEEGKRLTREFMRRRKGVKPESCVKMSFP